MFRSSILGLSARCSSILENCRGTSLIAKRTFAVNNNAVIVGKTIDTRQLGTTKKIVVIETKDEVRGVSQTHIARVITKTQFAKGTRLYLSGILRSRKIPSQNQKSRDMTVINADTWSVLEASENSAKDENLIRLNGRVASEVIHKENHSVFAIAYDLPAKTIEDRKSEFHTVFIFETNDQSCLRKALKKGDYIHLKGQMQSNNFVDTKGRKRRSGMIVADSIYKRSYQRNEVQDDETVEDGELDENDEFSDDDSDEEKDHRRGQKKPAGKSKQRREQKNAD